MYSSLSISSLKKNSQETVRLFSQYSVLVSILSQTDSVYLSIFYMSYFFQATSTSTYHSSVQDLVDDEVPQKNKQSLILDQSWTRQIISRIWPKLIAAVDDRDSLLPSGSGSVSHQTRTPGWTATGISRLTQRLCSTGFWNPGHCEDQSGKYLGFVQNNSNPGTRQEYAVCMYKCMIPYRNTDS